jgi:4-aminobutyrate aminotransferase-like enzyme
VVTALAANRSLAQLARTGGGELLKKAAAGDADATAEVAKQTGVDPAHIEQWAQDFFAASGADAQAEAQKLVATDAASDVASGGVNAGGTVAHLTGFRGAQVDAPPPAVAQALTAVMGGLPLELLAEPVKSQVAALLEDGVDAARTRDGAKAVYERASEAIGEDTVRDAIGNLAVAANDLAHASSEGLEQYTRGDDDSRNWHRTWGLNLLPLDDKAFRDPEYLMALNAESGQVQSHFQGRKTKSRAKQRFEDAWEALSPTTRPVSYAASGSDAVSLCFDLARLAGRKNLGIRDNAEDPRQWGVAFFEGAYGGGRGLAAGMNWEPYNKENRPNLEKWKLPDCSTTSLEPTDPAECQRLDEAEDEALTKLRAMAEDETHPIGAIMLEPLLGSKGVRCYRKSFVEQLRALADELKLPLIADEVLTSGGRTGRFFAMEHYGVQADFATFGKGVQACGIAAGQTEMARKLGFSWGGSALGITTTEGDAVQMLKGAKVLERIAEDGLIEQTADVGSYLVEQLRELQASTGKEVEATGFGALIGVDLHNLPVDAADGGKRRRLMPPLTLTRDDVDAVIADMKGGRR